MGRARSGLIALAAGFLAVPINAVGASSDTALFCDLAEELDDHIQETFELQEAASTGDSDIDPEHLDEQLDLADATTREYALEMVAVAPIEARAALRLLAEDGVADTSEVALEAIEASVFDEECLGVSLLFKVDQVDGSSRNLATGGVVGPLAIDQMVPAIEAVRTEIGADVAICQVFPTFLGVFLSVTDGGTTRSFSYRDDDLRESDPVIEFSGCASVDEVLTFDPGIFHDFIAEHRDANFALNSFTEGVFVYGGEVITSNGGLTYQADAESDGTYTRFFLDPNTGETISTVQ